MPGRRRAREPPARPGTHRRNNRRQPGVTSRLAPPLARRSPPLRAAGADSRTAPWGVRVRRRVTCSPRQGDRGTVGEHGARSSSTRAAAAVATNGTQQRFRRRRAPCQLAVRRRPPPHRRLARVARRVRPALAVRPPRPLRASVADLNAPSPTPYTEWRRRGPWPGGRRRGPAIPTPTARPASGPASRNGVEPSADRTSMPAPQASRTSAADPPSPAAAQCRGVSLAASLACTSAPRSSSARTATAASLNAAACNGVDRSPPRA